MQHTAVVPNIQNPPGYDISIESLQDFERGLDPLHPEKSNVSCHILGYGEISTVFEIQAPSLHGLAFKRMCCFESTYELKPYLDTFLEYNRIIEDEAGLHLPPFGYAQFISDNGRPIFYIIQKRLHPASIVSKALKWMSPQETTVFIELVLQALQNIWSFNQAHTDCQIGIDGQISNWAIEGLNPEQPHLDEHSTLYYLDTSTPFLRLQGQEQLDPELFLRSAPPYLTWILRALFLKGVMNRYYDARMVAIDLLANIYKEQRAELIPDLVFTVNSFYARHTGGQETKPVEVKEVSDYYREDRIIWSLYLSMRRFDRFARGVLLEREYPYILPGKIKR